VEPTPDQQLVCSRFGVTPDAPPPDSRMGIALNVRESDLWPLNGLRHPAGGGTNGWYIWRGEQLSHADDFFDFGPRCCIEAKAEAARGAPMT
jgi:hypothetical protein